MSTNKRKYERHITPAGVAMYPRLNAPDFKYKKETGEYSVKLKLSADQAAPLIELIKAKTEEAYKVYCAKEEKTKLKRSTNIPFKTETDDQEKETGNVIFSFKLPGKVKSTKTQEVFELKPNIFDKYGKKLEAEVWGGSTVKVAFEMRPYYTEGLGVGMTLRVVAVQVMELVTRGQGGTADSYGFSVEEEPEADIPDDEETESPKKEPADAKAKGDF